MKKLPLCLSFMFLLTACQADKSITPTLAVVRQAPMATEIPSEGECLPPIANFSVYPTGGERPGPTPVTQLPLDSWQAITAITDIPDTEAIRKDSADIEVLQTVDGDDRLWARFEETDGYHLAYYQITAGRWRTVDYDTNHGDSPKVFLGANSSLWLATNPRNFQGVSADAELLSVYDEASQQFKRVLVLKDLPTFDANQHIDQVTVTNLQTDIQGDLWFFLAVSEENTDWDYQLMKLSRSSHTPERHLANFKLNGMYGSSFVISSDGVLYVLGMKKASLIQYNPANGHIEEIEIPPQVADGGTASTTTLFLDRQQRLWINDKGWLDLFPGGDWHVIIPSPVFIFIQPGNGLWSRTQPSYSIAGPDGRLWYSSQRGTGWVDPTSGKWCLFTSYSSKVVSDSQRYLWLMANGKLYKSVFQP
jgi:hypothetical protein